MFYQWVGISQLIKIKELEEWLNIWDEIMVWLVYDNLI
jgi:hypothetical protein